MNDQEILEWAARAAGYQVSRSGECLYLNIGEERIPWNPLLYVGDCFQLSLALQITLDFRGCSTRGPAYVTAAYHIGRSPLWETVRYLPEEMFTPNHHRDERFALYLIEEGTYIRGLEAASRRAITLAAARIGKQKP